jgi:NADP-dependent aldehyde dehydrogenase
VVNGWPYPATSDARVTSVGTRATERFLRPVCYPDVPQNLLPSELRDGEYLPP